jgi:hypothetical protein
MYLGASNHLIWCDGHCTKSHHVLLVANEQLNEEYHGEDCGCQHCPVLHAYVTDDKGAGVNS